MLISACSSSEEELMIEDTPSDGDPTINILSLGDSYTIGQSVCDTCRFPAQLLSELEEVYQPEKEFELEIIAQTGWTTSNLITAIEAESIASDYDLVTLLIGVNNQFQNKPFELYQNEFPKLLQTAIRAAQNDKNRVIVVSIPDYGFTPFGQNYDQEKISEEIDAYNAFAKGYSESQNVSFVTITDITRQGLDNPDLVAPDDLHPSELAYSLFVERILPLAMEKI